MVPETNMPVRFYLTPNREDGSSSILVAEPLDYETTRNFILRVRAQNVAAVPLAAFTTVYVNVTGKCLYVFRVCCIELQEFLIHAVQYNKRKRQKNKKNTWKSVYN